MGADNLEKRMNIKLGRLGLTNWKVNLLPNVNAIIHGKADPQTGTITIYDVDDEEAWTTFIHEVVEIKLRKVIQPYRKLVNNLIQTIQEISDAQKDEFIEGLPEIFEEAQS